VSKFIWEGKRVKLKIPEIDLGGVWKILSYDVITCANIGKSCKIPYNMHISCFQCIFNFHKLFRVAYRNNLYRACAKFSLKHSLYNLNNKHLMKLFTQMLPILHVDKKEQLLLEWRQQNHLYLHVQKYIVVALKQIKKQLIMCSNYIILFNSDHCWVSMMIFKSNLPMIPTSDFHGCICLFQGSFVFDNAKRFRSLCSSYIACLLYFTFNFNHIRK